MVGVYQTKENTELFFLRLFMLFCLNSLVFELKSEELRSTFFELSLQQLGDIEITSVAKKKQKKSNVAASIFVLSQEDIKRSGVTAIPDALRLVPGVQVAKLDANKWAISIRGFNDIFSNKLLILMDGRSVYSPFFGGAYWDTVDTVLEDIDRIEVIRGSGGTLWGANAVNGVINIITKNSRDSSGLLISALAGNKERAKLTVRYGGKINAETNYRVYAKGFEKTKAEKGVDDWRMGRVGFRIDTEPSKKDKLTLQSDIYAGKEGERAISNLDTAPFGTFASEADVFGANVLFHWQRELADGSDFSFQSYYDRTDREHFFVKDSRDTVDLDFQHRFKTFMQQEVIWGLGFRYISDETSAGTLMRLSPASRSDYIYSGFFQDEISLIDEQLILTLGSKVEHNSVTGFEYQPSARLLWKPFAGHSVWAAVSRAIRIPSRIEQDAILQRTILPGPLALNIVGSRDMDAENLLSYETGYRFLNEQFSFDISLFYNNYQNLRSLERGVVIQGTPNVVPLVLDNELEGESYGLELAATWQVFETWRLQGGYSFIQIQLHPTSASNDNTEEADEGDTPQHQFSLRSLWQVSDSWQMDSSLRYVDLVRAAPETSKEAVDSYFTIDTRVAWKVDKAVELSLIGQNLLGKHREFRGSTVETQATNVEPSVFFKADFHF